MEQVANAETVNGRRYTVTRQETHERTRALQMANGWDAYCYALRGSRGACYYGLRSAKTGELHIVANLRF